jgi:hypothetical protein
MDSRTIVIIILALLLTIYLARSSNVIEPFYPMLQQGTTRNMSYDIRGDPYIPFRQVSPWNNPEVLPIRNPEIFLY